MLNRLSRAVLLFAALAGFAGCGLVNAAPSGPLPPPTTDVPLTSVPTQEGAVFAGGCFWCVEEAFEKVPGVIRAVSGYTGGTVDRPTYEDVSSKSTGHYEAVQVTFDPTKVSYAQLVDWFWHNIDPLAVNAQFCDHGTQYRSAIFYQGDEQKRVAEPSKEALEKSHRFDKPIATQIVAASTFWPAEAYHQHFYKTNPVHYKFYRLNCGRDQRLEQLWGKPNS